MYLREKLCFISGNEYLLFIFFDNFLFVIGHIFQQIEWLLFMKRGCSGLNLRLSYVGYFDLFVVTFLTPSCVFVSGGKKY